MNNNRIATHLPASQSAEPFGIRSTHRVFFVLFDFFFSLFQLDMKRIYTKPRGRVPDYDAPVVVPSSKCTIEEFCMRIHRSLLEQFKHALVRQTSALPPPARAAQWTVGCKQQFCVRCSLIVCCALDACVCVCASGTGRCGEPPSSVSGHSATGPLLIEFGVAPASAWLSSRMHMACSLFLFDRVGVGWCVCADAPQKCGRDHELADEDVVQIVKRIN